MNDDSKRKDFIPDGSGQLIDYEPLSKEDKKELINQEEINEKNSDLSPEKFKESRSVLLGVEKRTYIKWRENQKIRPRQLARIESGLKKEYRHLALQYVINPAALIELIKDTSHFMFEAVWETPLDRIRRDNLQVMTSKLEKLVILIKDNNDKKRSLMELIDKVSEAEDHAKELLDTLAKTGFSIFASRSPKWMGEQSKDPNSRYACICIVTIKLDKLKNVNADFPNDILLIPRWESALKLNEIKEDYKSLIGEIKR
tara:strand:+ start:237 stop:1007 length:771 start_codon:yes stop_codon:yes gene_type:complete